MKPQAKFQAGERVLFKLKSDELTGTVIDSHYSQHVNRFTGEPVDEWSWVYRVELDFGEYTDVLPCMEQFLQAI